MRRAMIGPFQLRKGSTLKMPPGARGYTKAMMVMRDEAAPTFGGIGGWGRLGPRFALGGRACLTYS